MHLPCSRLWDALAKRALLLYVLQIEQSHVAWQVRGTLAVCVASLIACLAGGAQVVRPVDSCFTLCSSSAAWPATLRASHGCVLGAQSEQ